VLAYLLNGHDRHALVIEAYDHAPCVIQPESVLRLALALRGVQIERSEREQVLGRLGA
jgi:hypothetical protein